MRSFAASALLVALFVAGCGGGGSSRLSRIEYAKQADRICLSYNAKLNGLPQPKSQAELSAFVGKAVPLVSDASDRLAELKPPQDEQRIADSWNQANSDIVRALQGLQDAAKAKNNAKMQTELAAGNKANSRANTLAKTLGMNACSK
ncbi:MAG: hypothetical protein ABI948_02705 [Thermoleophilia bacterium]